MEGGGDGGGGGGRVGDRKSLLDSSPLWFNGNGTVFVAARGMKRLGVFLPFGSHSTFPVNDPAGGGGRGRGGGHSYIWAKSKVRYLMCREIRKEF